MEDDEARMFFRTLVPHKYLKNIAIVNVSIGGNELLDLVKRKIGEFMNSLIVLDGDKTSPKRNVISLPGKGVGPDRLLYDFLNGLRERDPFWTDDYTKQMCFKEFMDRDEGEKPREFYKRWFKREKENWGTRGLNAYKYWKQRNPHEAQEFLEEYIKALKYQETRQALSWANDT